MSSMIFNNRTLIVLEEFSSDYKKKIYGRNISRKLKMNQKTVSNILNNLEKQNILKFTQEGKNKYYFINKFNSNIKEIIKLIEINRKIRFIEKYKRIQDLFKKLEEKTEGILVIFGSYANFSSNEKSDIDLFVMGKIKEIRDLEQLYNIKANIIISEKNKFNAKEHIIQEIIKNHIILKGVEEFIELIW